MVVSAKRLKPAPQKPLASPARQLFARAATPALEKPVSANASRPPALPALTTQQEKFVLGSLNPLEQSVFTQLKSGVVQVNLKGFSQEAVSRAVDNVLRTARLASDGVFSDLIEKKSRQDANPPSASTIPKPPLPASAEKTSGPLIENQSQENAGTTKAGGEASAELVQVQEAASNARLERDLLRLERFSERETLKRAASAASESEETSKREVERLAGLSAAVLARKLKREQRERKEEARRVKLEEKAARKRERDKTRAEAQAARLKREQVLLRIAEDKALARAKRVEAAAAAKAAAAERRRARINAREADAARISAENRAFFDARTGSLLGLRDRLVEKGVLSEGAKLSRRHVTLYAKPSELRGLEASWHVAYKWSLALAGRATKQGGYSLPRGIERDEVERFVSQLAFGATAIHGGASRESRVDEDLRVLSELRRELKLGSREKIEPKHLIEKRGGKNLWSLYLRLQGYNRALAGSTPSAVQARDGVSPDYLSKVRRAVSMVALQGPRDSSGALLRKYHAVVLKAFKANGDRPVTLSQIGQAAYNYAVTRMNKPSLVSSLPDADRVLAERLIAMISRPGIGSGILRGKSLKAAERNLASIREFVERARMKARDPRLRIQVFELRRARLLGEEKFARWVHRVDKETLPTLHPRLAGMVLKTKRLVGAPQSQFPSIEKHAATVKRLAVKLGRRVTGYELEQRGLRAASLALRRVHSGELNPPSEVKSVFLRYGVVLKPGGRRPQSKAS